MQTENNIPISKLKRASITGLTAAKIGIKHASYRARTLISTDSRKDKLKKDHEENLGKLIFSVLSQLKGTALKVSQLLSMEADILPKNIRNQLINACHQAPPINRALVRKQVIQELGDKPTNRFKYFNPEAFAAASIGQVHRAETFDGQKIAVKIQYPGIASTIESDIKIIEKLFWTISKTSNLLPPKIVIDLIMKEMQDRLREEVNYEVEAESLKWFRKNLTLDGVIIPKVVDDLSAKRLLTLEMLDGLHLKEWLETNPSQNDKNRLGQLLFDFFWYSVYKLNRINADPHPGNFLFMPDGNLGVLDFGCVRSLNAEFVEQFSKLIPACVRAFYQDGDSNSLREAYQALKILPTETNQEQFESVMLPSIEKFGRWFGQAYVGNSFDFSKKSACPGRPDSESMQAIKLLSGMYEEQICFDRAHLGLMNILTEMGAVITTDWAKFR